MQAPRGKQLKIHGNVVNVPADVVNTVSMLPRLPSETGTVEVNADWIIDFNGEILETESSESACHQQYVTDEQNCNNVASHNLDNEDKLSEDEVEVPEGVTDTMLRLAF